MSFAKRPKGLVPIKGFEGLYAINREGQVYSYPRQGSSTHGMILKHGRSKSGYTWVALCKGGVRRHYYLHKLLGTTFLTNPENKKEVNHKNGIKTDFRLENLEWTTPSENCQHANDTGLHISPRGEEAGKAKLTEQMVIEIRQKYRSGLFTTRQLAAQYPVNPSNIWKAIKGVSWSHI